MGNYESRCFICSVKVNDNVTYCTNCKDKCQTCRRTIQGTKRNAGSSQYCSVCFTLLMARPGIDY